MDKFLSDSSKKRNVSEVTNSIKTEKKRKYRKYDDAYLDFGFTCTVVGNEERPQCVICFKVLAAESMLPNKMKRHLEAVHGNLLNKPREYFSSKLKEMAQQQATFTKQATIPRKALLSSYKVAYRVAKSKKPHTIAEDLILPAAMDMVSIMIGESAAKQLRSVPLSDNTISRRIFDMADDINDQLNEKLKGRYFAIQLDEATDSHNDAHLICYVRFIGDDNKFHEDLLFCRTIKFQTKAVDLFQMVDSFMAENNINWEACVGVCTDGARSMAGCYGGLKALIQKKAPLALWTHCIIHREALASKNISSALNEVLQSVIEVVNFIKTRPQKSRCFEQICADMGAEHTSLLYYCNSRWLSRGNVLSRVFELRRELHLYLLDQKYFEKFEDSIFLSKLAYLCDIFKKLNLLNLSLQGNETHILELKDKIAAFQRKLALWKTKMEDKNLIDCFPTLHAFLSENDLTLNEAEKFMFLDHLSQLIVHFEKYFPEDIQQHDWIKDPFTSDPPQAFTTSEKEQFIDITSDSRLKSKFLSSSLSQFWTSVKQEYPDVANKALHILIPFATSYLCEAGFSAVAVIKTKYRSKVNVEKEMRIAISKLVPRFEYLMNSKQAHPSH